MTTCRSLRPLFTIIFVLLLLAGALAKEGEDLQFLEAEKLNSLMNDNAELTLVNVLSLIEFRDCSIPNSISIPYETIQKTENLPKDKNSLLIFYCCSERCLLSRKTAQIAQQELGYTDVYVLNGGLPAWKLKGYPTVSLERVERTNILSLKPKALSECILKNKECVILDIRPPEYFQQRRFEGSINIPMAFLEKRYHELPLNKTVIIVDEVGHRSFIAARYLKMKGIEDVLRLFGGIEEWVSVLGEESLIKANSNKK